MQAAIRAQASHLLTGDIKDFGRFMNKPKKTAGILIQTIAEFLASPRMSKVQGLGAQARPLRLR